MPLARKSWVILAPLAMVTVALAQQDVNCLSPSAGEKWKLFVTETVSPLALGSGAFNAGLSQFTSSDPKYGAGPGPFGQRFGASMADIATQNFFGDYVAAAILHEDTRYVRLGREHGFWPRVTHAAASGFVTRSDTGGRTFNWSNVAGTAISAGISSAYYPAPSRTGPAIAIHFGTSLVGAGLGNLAPEFWPDFRHWLSRHHLAHSDE